MSSRLAGYHLPHWRHRSRCRCCCHPCSHYHSVGVPRAAHLLLAACRARGRQAHRRLCSPSHLVTSRRQLLPRSLQPQAESGIFFTPICTAIRKLPLLGSRLSASGCWTDSMKTDGQLSCLVLIVACASCVGPWERCVGGVSNCWNHHQGFSGPVSLRSQPAVSSHAGPGSDPHTARVRSVSESTGACVRLHAAGDCKRESLPNVSGYRARIPRTFTLSSLFHNTNFRVP
jgi:hypothetical protein